jgi:hypothetical protein
MSDVAFMVASLAGDAAVAAMLMTRVRVKPGAFSPGLLLILFVTFISGALIGVVASLMVGAIGGSGATVVALQLGVTAAFCAGVIAVGFVSLDRLARGFVFS